jgi:prepilin signal peptidase PulO-like enzyme (type II secretory pathway)
MSLWKSIFSNGKLYHVSYIVRNIAMNLIIEINNDPEFLNMVWIICAALLGACMASFAGAMADRLSDLVNPSCHHPRTLGGRSQCDHCHRTLKWFELIPILGWVMTQGRCYTCKTHIPICYPIIELLSAVLSGLVAWSYGPIWAGAALLILGWGLLIIAWTDIISGWIPERLSIPLLLLGLISPFSGGWLSSIIGSLIFAVTMTGAHAFVSWRKRINLMNGGDLMLAAVAGAWIGWGSWLEGLQRLAIFLIGSVILQVIAILLSLLFKTHWKPRGIVADLIKDVEGDSTILPFGPVLCVVILLSCMLSH